MLKDGRPEDTLLAITDRTGHHAVVASNAGGESVQKGTEVFDSPAEFLKSRIPLLHPLRHHLVYDFLSR